MTTQISFDWDQPQCGQRHGQTIGYDYKFGEDIGNDNAAEVISTKNTSVTIYDLKHYTKYEFQVRAKTYVGSGPYSDIYSATTAESCKSIDSF